MDKPMEARNYVADVQLEDGATIRIRSIKTSDKTLLQKLFHNLSDRSIYYRFFSNKRELSPADLDYLTGMDYVQHVALAAAIPLHAQETSPGPEHQVEQIIGVGRYVVLREHSAEVAYAVADAHQHRGIGSALLQNLVTIARASGVTTFVADVLIENLDQQRSFLTHNGFSPAITVLLGVAHLSFSLVQQGHT